jgi:hypothetical protein
MYYFKVVFVCVCVRVYACIHVLGSFFHISLFSIFIFASYTYYNTQKIEILIVLWNKH